MKTIETIEEELKGWQQSMELRGIVLKQLKRSLLDNILEVKQRKKQINRELRELINRQKEGQRCLNKAKRDFKDAKDNVKRLKKKKSSYNYTLRTWTNRNVGKLISKIEKVESEI